MPSRDRFSPDTILSLQREVRALRRIAEARDPNTSIPLYDPTNPPPDFIENQLLWDVVEEKTKIVIDGTPVDVVPEYVPPPPPTPYVAPTLPKVALTMAASYSPTHGWVDISWDTEIYDTSAMHSGTNPERITCVQEGLYSFKMCVEFDTPTQQMQNGLRLGLNGTTVICQDLRTVETLQANDAPITMAWEHYLVVGDYVQLQTYHDNNGPPLGLLQINQTSYSPIIKMSMIGLANV